MGALPWWGSVLPLPIYLAEQQGRVLWTLGCGSQGPDAPLIPTLGACGDILCRGPHRAPPCPPAADLMGCGWLRATGKEGLG